jgi:hypothetical protein
MKIFQIADGVKGIFHRSITVKLNLEITVYLARTSANKMDVNSDTQLGETPTNPPTSPANIDTAKQPQPQQAEDNILDAGDDEAILVEVVQLAAPPAKPSEMSAVDIYISRMQGKPATWDGGNGDLDEAIEIPRRSANAPMPVVERTFNNASGWTETRTWKTESGKEDDRYYDDDVDTDLQQTVSNIDGKADLVYEVVQAIRAECNEIYEDLTSVADMGDDVQKRVIAVSENVVKVGNFMSKSNAVMQNALVEMQRDQLAMQKDIVGLIKSQQRIEGMLSALLKAVNVVYTDPDDMT